MYVTEFDEFRRELERRNWHKELTNFAYGSIDVAGVKEFYANLYDLEDKLPKQVRVRGYLIKFDVDASTPSSIHRWSLRKRRASQLTPNLPG